MSHIIINDIITMNDIIMSHIIMSHIIIIVDKLIRLFIGVNNNRVVN